MKSEFGYKYTVRSGDKTEVGIFADAVLTDIPSLYETVLGTKDVFDPGFTTEYRDLLTEKTGGRK